MSERSDEDRIQDDLDRRIRSQQPPAPSPSLLDRCLQTIGPKQIPRMRAGIRVRLAQTTAAAAALVVVSLALLYWTNMGSSPAWAQIVEEVRVMPWILATSQTSGGEPAITVWYGPTEGVVASNVGIFANYADLSAGVGYKYDLTTNTVYRLPLNEDQVEEHLRNLEVWEALFRGDDIKSLPLGDVKVSEQKKRTFTENGRLWIEYDLKLEDDTADGAGRCLIRVDGETRLPHSVIMEGFSMGPNLNRMEFLCSYPDDGPTNIFETGIPEHAIQLDLVPSPALAKLADTVTRSRDGFDPYRSLVIESAAEQPWWQAQALHRVWRNGTLWRIERTGPEVEERLSAFEEPPPSTDPATWWAQAAARMDFRLISVCDGEHSYVLTSGREKGTVGIWKQRGSRLLPLGTRSSWRVMPELVAYPVFGVPGDSFEPSLQQAAADGPPGTARLDLRWTKHAWINKLDSRTFWIDPARGYVTLQWETRPENRHPEHSQTHLYRLEGLRQSPNQLWYPTLMRWSTDGRPAKVLRYYCDFNPDLPSWLFQKPVAAE